MLHWNQVLACYTVPRLLLYKGCYGNTTPILALIIGKNKLRKKSLFSSHTTLLIAHVKPGQSVTFLFDTLNGIGYYVDRCFLSVCNLKFDTKIRKMNVWGRGDFPWYKNELALKLIDNVGLHFHKAIYLVFKYMHWVWS